MNTCMSTTGLCDRTEMYKNGKPGMSRKQAHLLTNILACTGKRMLLSVLYPSDIETDQNASNLEDL